MLRTKAKMDTVFYDETSAYEGQKCEIRINGGEIAVSYEDEDDLAVYKGKDEGHGHFELERPEKGGKATLHQMPNSKSLEGYWVEGGYKGFWRIILP